MDLKGKLLDFLAFLPEVDGPDKRKAVIALSGFSHVGIYLDWHGSNIVFFTRLLEEFGRRDKESLLQFLEGLSTLPHLGVERQEQAMQLRQAVETLSAEEWQTQFAVVEPGEAGEQKLDADMLATSIVSTVLTPYFKFGKKGLQQEMGAGAMRLAEQIWEKVEAAFSADPGTSALLGVYRTTPETVQTALVPLLQQKLKSDPTVAQDLANLLTSAEQKEEATLRTIINVAQKVGAVKGELVGAVFGKDALPHGANLAVNMQIDEVSGTAIGLVMGGDGDTHIGDRHTYGDQYNAPVDRSDRRQSDNRHIETSGGAYIGGNATAGGNFIGRDKITTTQYGLNGDELAALFDQVYQQIEHHPPDPNVDRDEIEETTRKIQEEVQKGGDANVTKVERWLKTLKEIAPDVLEVIAGVLVNPVAGVADDIRRVAAQMRL
ncbi:hypothetical protein KDA23_04165 [Candidatus Saccharibacteria bacterium]|nr:hypothetical protein [Candidatus Saccharibacteria bacterium]